MFRDGFFHGVIAWLERNIIFRYWLDSFLQCNLEISTKVTLEIFDVT